MNMSERLRVNRQIKHRLVTWERLWKALEQLEWVINDGDDEDHCPSCRAWSHQGHREWCNLRAALETAKEE